MALKNEEILRLKYELGYNVSGVGADVYLGYTAIFDRAVQPYLIDVGTTSTTTVAASVAGAAVAVTLAANPVSPFTTQATAFVPGTSVVVDLGPNQETSIIQSLTGLVATMTLNNAHGPTVYPVLVQGAEQIVRDIFARLDILKSEITNTAPLTAGISALTGEVEFYTTSKGRRGGRSKFDDLIFQRTIARRDLAGAIGVPYLGDIRQGASGAVELY